MTLSHAANEKMRKAKEKEETAIGKSPTITALNLSS
jgi:hypothetical protein